MTDLLLTDATWLDLHTGTTHPGTSVRVRGDRITDVAPGRTLEEEPGEPTLDARGLTLLPGLIDAHVHATLSTLDLNALAHRSPTRLGIETKAVLEGMLTRGFTTVRDAGGLDRGIAEALDARLIQGPRVFRSGRVIEPDRRSRRHPPARRRPPPVRLPHPDHHVRAHRRRSRRRPPRRPRGAQGRRRRRDRPRPGRRRHPRPFRRHRGPSGGDLVSHLIDLSHPIRLGQSNHPGLPGPTWEAFRSRDHYRATTGTEFQVDQVVMVGNTGTYLDSPFHRFPDGHDLAGIPLAAVADLPAVVVDARGRRAVDAQLLTDQLGSGAAVDGAAVLLRTGGDRAYGTSEYFQDAPHLTGDAADLVGGADPGARGHRRGQHRRPGRPRPAGTHDAARRRGAHHRAPHPAARAARPRCPAARRPAGLARHRHLARPRVRRPAGV